MAKMNIPAEPNWTAKSSRYGFAFLNQAPIFANISVTLLVRKQVMLLMDVLVVLYINVEGFLNIYNQVLTIKLLKLSSTVPHLWRN
jgi:hypothetical protein